MLYVLLLHEDEALYASRSQEDHKKLLDEYLSLEEEMKKNGHYVIGKALMPTDTATTVQVRGEKTVMTDGPFTETKEQMAGLYVLECENLDQALLYAAKIPMSRTGSIEVRPVMSFDESGPVMDA